MKLCFIAAGLMAAAVYGFEIDRQTAVILPENPESSSTLAASELKEYVQKTSGIRLSEDRKAAKRIYIGTVRTLKNIPSPLAEKLKKAKGDDAYAVSVKGNSIYIAGKTKPGELYGVYQFLEEQLGIRWFKPANKEDDGEYVPQLKRIVIPEMEYVRDPAFVRRLLVPTAWNWIDHPVNGVIWSVRGGFQMRAAYYHNVRWKRKKTNLVNLYDPRTADIWEENDHSLIQRAVPAKKYFKDHPEYFALSNGKRSAPSGGLTCYCLSNPEVRRLTAEYIIREIEAKKAMGLRLLQGGGMADTGKGWCECAECLKMNEGKSFDWKNISTVYNKAFQDIFGQVLKKHPEAELMIWAYHTYRKPPRRNLVQDPRVHSLFLPHGRCYAHEFDSQCSRNRELFSWMKEYISRYRRTSVYEYFLCSGGRNYVPQEIVQAHDLKLFSQCGVTGWEEETFFEDSAFWKKTVDSSRNEKLPSLWQWLYLTGKMLWNPNLDPEKLLEDAESKYYGNAWPAMKKYHAMRRKLWKNTPNCFGYPFANERLPLLLNRPEDTAQLLSLLDQAEKLAAGDPKRLCRVRQDRKFLKKYWIKANDDYRKLQGQIIKAPTLTSPVKIDGKGDEPAWKRAFYISNFKNTFSKEHEPIPAEAATSAGFLSDRENLYILIHAKEPHPEKMILRGDIWKDSAIEIFLHPQSISNEYYHIAITPKGVLYDARCPENNSKFSTGTEHKTVIGKDGFVMEIKIPAARLGDFRNGAVWKCHVARNRMLTDKETHYSINGTRYHQTTGYLPLEIGTPININGNFSIAVKNNRKYPPSLKVLPTVPAGWYANLPQKDSEYGIRKDASPYDNTLYCRNVFACRSLDRIKPGTAITIHFEAKGKGCISPAVTRYQRKPFKFLKTEYLGPRLELKPQWQKFSAAYTVQPNESIHLAFNVLQGEAQLDNVSIVTGE